MAAVSAAAASAATSDPATVRPAAAFVAPSGPAGGADAAPKAGGAENGTAVPVDVSRGDVDEAATTAAAAAATAEAATSRPETTASPAAITATASTPPHALGVESAAPSPSCAAPAAGRESLGDGSVEMTLPPVLPQRAVEAARAAPAPRTIPMTATQSKRGGRGGNQPFGTSPAMESAVAALSGMGRAGPKRTDLLSLQPKQANIVSLQPRPQPQHLPQPKQAALPPAPVQHFGTNAAMSNAATALSVRQQWLWSASQAMAGASAPKTSMVTGQEFGTTAAMMNAAAALSGRLQHQQQRPLASVAAAQAYPRTNQVQAQVQAQFQAQVQAQVQPLVQPQVQPQVRRWPPVGNANGHNGWQQQQRHGTDPCPEYKGWNAAATTVLSKTANPRHNPERVAYGRNDDVIHHRTHHALPYDNGAATVMQAWQKVVAAAIEAPPRHSPSTAAGFVGPRQGQRPWGDQVQRQGLPLGATAAVLRPASQATLPPAPPFVVDKDPVRCRARR